MAKPANQKMDDLKNFEESIKHYGEKIEHIATFTEAVRRFPGKRYTAWLDRNIMK